MACSFRGNEAKNDLTSVPPGDSPSSGVRKRRVVLRLAFRFGGLVLGARFDMKKAPGIFGEDL
jgi:hypothetical protein